MTLLAYYSMRLDKPSADKSASEKKVPKHEKKESKKDADAKVPRKKGKSPMKDADAGSGAKKEPKES